MTRSDPQPQIIDSDEIYNHCFCFYIQQHNVLFDQDKEVAGLRFVLNVPKQIKFVYA